MSNIETTTAAITAAHAETVGAWTGADWTHELNVDGRRVADENGDAIICHGGSSECELCEEATEAATEAAGHAADVVADWLAGDPLGALAGARDARGDEIRYGDTPVYGPLVDAVEAAIHTMADSSQTWAEQHGEAVASV